MGSIRTLKETRTLFFDFRYAGKRCREYTSLTDNATNRKKLQKVLGRIEFEIQSGAFEYARFFPNSRMAASLGTAGTIIVGAQGGARSSPGVPVAATSDVAALVDAPTLSTYADTWFASHEIEWKRSYRLTVRGMLDQHVIPQFGVRPVSSLTRDEILLFRGSLGRIKGRGKRESLSPKRINQIMGVLQRLLDDASERYGFLNPYRKIKPLRLSKSDVQPFSLDEVRLLVSTVRPDYRHYLTVRCFTGLRTGEVDGLRWEWVDFDRRLILVRETIVRGEVDTTKTYESVRDIAMSQPVFEALKSQYEATGKDGGYVFCNREGQPLDHNNFTKRVWYPLLRYLGLKPRRPYQMRHTAATIWLAAGESPEWIARQMGHTTTEMLFKVYSRYVPNLTRRDGSAFERLLIQTGVCPPVGSANDDAGSHEPDALNPAGAQTGKRAHG